VNDSRIHNTDDHLRNHGFFIDEQGIQLSPAYDINPSVNRNEVSLAIDETETTLRCLRGHECLQELWDFHGAGE
jgi:hypothetical protein